jgi:malonyl-CoA O-methyltransferase
VVLGNNQRRAIIGSIYCPAMTQDAPIQTLRPVQPQALAHIVRRMRRAPEAPWLHGEVARRMAERLALIRLEPRTVVDWWSFNGASRQLLLRAYAQARLLCVEADAGPPRPARAGASPWWSPRRWAAAPQAQVVAPSELAAGGAGLLWANMMLHWVEDPAALLQQWQRALAVDGFVMFSTLGPGSLLGLRRIYRQWQWPAPFAPFVDMHDLGDLLLRAGFADPVMDQELITLTWPDADALLDELRTLGGNADAARWPGLRTPRWRRQLLAALQPLAAADGRLRLDFEVVYGHAFKVAAKPRVAPQTTVGLEEMRAMVRSPRRSGTPNEGLG